MRSDYDRCRHHPSKSDVIVSNGSVRTQSMSFVNKTPNLEKVAAYMNPKVKPVSPASRHRLGSDYVRQFRGR